MKMHALTPKTTSVVAEMLRIGVVSVKDFLLSTILISSMGCKMEEWHLVQMYSREIRIDIPSGNDVQPVLAQIEANLEVTLSDEMLDPDGNRVFLYSGEEVVITVGRVFAEKCSQTSCPWRIDITPARNVSSEELEKRQVDRAYHKLSRELVLLD